MTARRSFDVNSSLCIMIGINFTLSSTMLLDTKFEQFSVVKELVYREQKCQSLSANHFLARRCHCHSVQLIYNLQVSFMTQFIAVVCHDDPFTFVEMTPPKKAKFSVWVTVVSVWLETTKLVH